MGWHQARALRRDIDQEPQTYRVTRLLQPEGSHYWEIEVAHRPTGDVFCPLPARVVAAPWCYRGRLAVPDWGYWTAAPATTLGV